MNPNGDWREAASIPALGPNELHLIAVPLDLSQEIANRWQTFLSPAERERAERFAFPTHKTRFILGRATLRYVLGLYTSKDPYRVVLQAGAHGKLHLAPPQLLDIRFNVTHSEELAVFAVTLSLEIGVDVEKVDPGRATEDIASRYFSERERLDLAATPTEDQVEAFFRCWTRKEAYLKARGDGLSGVSLGSFAVTLLRDQEPMLFAPDSSRWHMVSIAPVLGFIGAVVFERSTPKISKFFLRPA